MGRNRPKNVKRDSKALKRARKVSNRLKDQDQIQEEMKNPIPLPINADLPGMGQYYCLSCARFFINQSTLKEHCGTALHKKLLKRHLSETPYSIRESEAAAGMAPSAK